MVFLIHTELRCTVSHTSDLNTCRSDSGQLSAQRHEEANKRRTRMRSFRLPENCRLLGYYAACSGHSLQTFRDNISVPATFKGQESRTEACRPSAIHHQIISLSVPLISLLLATRVNSTAIFRFQLRVMCRSRHAGRSRISRRCRLMRQHNSTNVNAQGLEIFRFFVQLLGLLFARKVTRRVGL